VTIGHDSVIGAHSLVNRDIPPFSMAVGSPAVIVRKIDPAKEGPIPDQYEPTSLYEALMIGNDGSEAAKSESMRKVKVVKQALMVTQSGSQATQQGVDRA
jgi:carbonic anhydrase/acetyltransferase-like protein (isoleucine patch superfamily)